MREKRSGQFLYEGQDYAALEHRLFMLHDG